MFIWKETHHSMLQNSGKCSRDFYISTAPSVLSWPNTTTAITTLISTTARLTVWSTITRISIFNLINSSAFLAPFIVTLSAFFGFRFGFLALFFFLSFWFGLGWSFSFLRLKYIFRLRNRKIHYVIVISIT